MTSRTPRIAIVGTGANGASIGADLVRAGHDVTFIEQWPDHVVAMRSSGLLVNMPSRSERTDVRAHHLCEVATFREKFDLVLLLVKAYDTRWACELIKPLLTDDATVIGVQNGMTLPDIAEIVGADRAVGCVIEVSSAMFDPGVVERHTEPERSWFALGGTNDVTRAKAEAAAPYLRAAGAVELVDDIVSTKWMKLIVNAGELVPSAILDLPMREALETPGMREVMLGAGMEAVEAAQVRGSRLVPIFGMPDLNLSDPREFVTAILDKVMFDFALPHTLTTVLQDWRKGRRCEVHEINGLVCDALASVGRPAPYNAAAVRLAALIESGELPASPANLELLTSAGGTGA